MRISNKGIELIKQFEGCRLHAYKCPAGVWTIGYGHTAGVASGQTITQEQADELLKGDLVKFEQKVSKYTSYGWSQEEFDALVSFAFNIGSIEQLTANGNRSRAVIAEKILLYNKANGKVLAGLTRRRKAEHEMFISRNAEKEEYYPVPNINTGSIVAALNNIKVDSSMKNRKRIAEVNGINNYEGSYAQNVRLLSLMKAKKLKKAL